MILKGLASLILYQSRGIDRHPLHQCKLIIVCHISILFLTKWSLCLHLAEPWPLHLAFGPFVSLPPLMMKLLSPNERCLVVNLIATIGLDERPAGATWENTIPSDAEAHGIAAAEMLDKQLMQRIFLLVPCINPGITSFGVHNSGSSLSSTFRYIFQSFKKRKSYQLALFFPVA